MNTISSVSLRKRKRNEEYSFLYLEFYPPIFLSETRETRHQISLGLKVYKNPKNDIQKDYNKKIMLKAEAIRSQRALDVVNKKFGFFDEDVLEGDFLQFFEKFARRKTDKSFAAYLHFKDFMNGKCRFKDINLELCDDFKEYLLKTAKKKDGNNLHNNTASAYWCLFRATLAEAFRKHMLLENHNDYLSKITVKQTRREFLTMPEVLMLCNTPCQFDVLKRAAIFSILTGLRISDIRSLQWENIQIAPDGGPCIMKRIVKTDRDEIIYISKEALSYCGQPYPTGTVFYGLTREMTIHPLKRWLKEAGITKPITFHCFRHTFATLQIARGIDIYTVSRQLSHRFVSTTQIYADLVDEKRRESANVLSLLPEIHKNSVDEQ